MAKPNKQVIINFIVSCLEKGEERAAILGKTGKKWEISRTVFDRLLKTAKEQHAERQQAIREQLAKVEAEAAIEARKKEIMTSDERKELLTKIAKGTLTEIIPDKDGKADIEVPAGGLDPMVRIKAISELNKMDGSYAPTKVAPTDKDGNDIPPVQDGQLDRLIQAIEKIQ